MKLPFVQIGLLVALGIAYVNSSILLGLAALAGLLLYPWLYDNWARSAIEEAAGETHVQRDPSHTVMDIMEIYEKGYRMVIPSKTNPNRPSVFLVGMWVADPENPKENQVFIRVGTYTPGVGYKDVDNHLRRPNPRRLDAEVRK